MPENIHMTQSSKNMKRHKKIQELYPHIRVFRLSLFYHFVCPDMEALVRINFNILLILEVHLVLPNCRRTEIM